MAPRVTRGKIIFESVLAAVFIGLGLYILIFSGRQFALAPWQRYGMGGFIAIYGGLKLILVLLRKECGYERRQQQSTTIISGIANPAL